MKDDLPIAILGAGSWGTALAIHLANNKQQVNLWEFDQDQVVAMQKDRANTKYLSGIAFPDSIHVFGDLEKAVSEVKDIFIVVPSHAFRQTLVSLKPFIKKSQRIGWATKGIEPESYQLFHEVVREILGERDMAVLSGPSFAKEVAEGLPVAVVIAANKKGYANEMAARFNRKAFRVYTSDDLIGVQLGGAVKNVIAIGVGISDGLKFGANARSALLTRALAEIVRLGVAMGAKSQTFMGLSGLGDLVLTCTEDQSRNRRLGLAIAKGKSIKAAEKELGQVVEGVHTVRQVMFLAKKHKVTMPVCEQIHRILQGEVKAMVAVKELFSREPKAE